MFADAAGWARPIRFAHQAGGHAAVLEIARQARRPQRPPTGLCSPRTAHRSRIDAGLVPPLGEFGSDGAVYPLSCSL
jgi:hypothetical protein